MHDKNSLFFCVSSAAMTAALLAVANPAFADGKGDNSDGSAGFGCTASAGGQGGAGSKGHTTKADEAGRTFVENDQI